MMDFENNKSILDLKTMCLEYFVGVSQGKTYTRRPPLALRLPHGDFTIVVKPMTKWDEDGGFVSVDDRGVLIECLFKLDSRLSAKWLSLQVTDTVRKTRWMRNESLTEEAITAVIDTAKEFVADPQEVIQRNKNNCCCCGKGLSDEVSRARGIGPECMQNVKMFLMQLLEV